VKDITTTVSFANVPVPEIGRLANALVEAGFVWRFNSSDWEAAFTKTIPSDSLIDELENEVREIMGDYYAKPGARTTKPDG